MNIRFGKMIILVALIGLVVTDIDAARGGSRGGGGGARSGGGSRGGGGGSRGGGGGGARMGGSAGGGRSFSGGSARVGGGRSTSFVGTRTGGVTRAAGVTRTGGRVAGTGALVGGARVAGSGVRTGARVGGARVAGRTFAGRRGIHGGRFGRGWGRRHGYRWRHARWGLLGAGFWLGYGYPDYYYRYYQPWTNSCRVVNDTNVEVLVSFGDVDRGLRLPAGEILYVPCGSDVIVSSAAGEEVIDLPSVDAETVIGSDGEGFYVY